MHLILTGGTGAVGSAVLDAMLKTPELDKISIISRRPVKMAEDARDPRVQVIIHEDFEKYDAALLDKLRGANGCVWALGVKQSHVDAEEYVKITKNYPLAAARAFQSLPATESEPFRFVFVSAEWSSQNPGMLTPYYGRVKGETESALAEMREANARLQAEAVRLAIVDFTQHDAIKAYVPQRAAVERFVIGFPGARWAFSSFWTPTEPLGRFLTEMASGKWDGKLKEHSEGLEKLGGGFNVVRNVYFRRAMGL